MNRRSLFVLAILGSLLLPTTTHAQTPEPRFFHLTTADGLSHNIVYAIAQDHQGLLWFGTQDGLDRYDGYTFTVFRHLRSNPQSLVHNTIQSLTVDRVGVLWVGTAGGLDRYDRDTGHFVHYPEIFESVTIIYEDREGTLWVGTAGSGLFRYDRQNDRFTPFGGEDEPGGEGKPRPYIGDNILALYQDRDGTLWVGTEYGGLWGIPVGAGLAPALGGREGRPYSLPHDRVSAIVQDRAGTLWVGTGALHEPGVGGLAALDPATGQFTPYHQGLAHKHITAILEDRTDTFWVGTENGLAILEHATGRFTVYHHDPLDSYSLVNDRVYALYEDRAGILWIATDGGVSRYVHEKNRFALYRHNPQDPNSLGAPRVGAILVTTKDTKDAEENLCVPSCPSWLWVGLHAGGLDRIDPATGTVTHYRHDPDDPHSLSHDHVTALYQDRSGAIWVGTSTGLDRLDPRSEGKGGESKPRPYFTHYVHDPNDPHSIGPGAVKVIYEDRSGALWIGTEEPGTLSRMDPASGTFTVYRYDPANPDRFPKTYGIRAILEDQAGNLWLGTYSGLVRFSPQSGAFTQYRHDPQDPHSLSNDFVWAIYEAPDGTLWVGTQGGLNRLDPGRGESEGKPRPYFTIYTIEDGLPNDGTATILSDEAGSLWLGTMGGGLSRFDPRTETFRNYDTSDGLQGMHFIPGAAYRSSDGELFFGGANGLNRFYPVNVQDNHHAPPIVLTAFHKFDRVMDFGRDLSDIREISLSYKDNFFSFEFAALDYADPVKNQYAYILEGFDRDWVYCGSRRYAAYTNVPPGTYTFRVKGSNNDGIWNEEGLAVRIVITPPFWATWWFRGLVTAVALGIVSGIYLVRARNTAALREREERFRTLFENAPLGVFEVDLSQSPPQILRANQEAARIYGWTAAELGAMPLDQLIADGAETDLERLLDRLRAGETITLESTHRRRDGSEFPTRVSAALQRASRRGQAAIVIVEDITMEKVWRSEEEAIAEERRRIAREIHDGLAQDLVSLRMRARLWHKLVDEAPHKMHAELDALRDLLSDNIREVRRAIFALRPVALDELGFYPALRQFAADFGEQNPVRVDLRLPDTEERLPAFLEAVLFRIVQESLHNVARHAQASTVQVELNLEEAGTVQLIIRDDGVGFDPALLEQAARSGHLGLKQMRERVVGLKGTFSLRSAPGQGTEIRVGLPVG